MMMNDDKTLLAMARAVAIAAHLGQTDKLGKPYIGHVIRVAEAAEKDAGVRAGVVGYLHDVVEDTAVTLGTLWDMGFPGWVVRAVDAMSHRECEPYDEYIKRLRLSPEARPVKRADLADNLDPSRLALLDPGTVARLRDKYERAEAMLEDTGPFEVVLPISETL